MTQAMTAQLGECIGRYRGHILMAPSRLPYSTLTKYVPDTITRPIVIHQTSGLEAPGLAIVVPSMRHLPNWTDFPATALIASVAGLGQEGSAGRQSV